jgi:hypothetical protein
MSSTTEHSTTTGGATPSKTVAGGAAGTPNGRHVSKAEELLHQAIALGPATQAGATAARAAARRYLRAYRRHQRAAQTSTRASDRAAHARGAQAALARHLIAANLHTVVSTGPASAYPAGRPATTRAAGGTTTTAMSAPGTTGQPGPAGASPATIDLTGVRPPIGTPPTRIGPLSGVLDPLSLPTDRVSLPTKWRYEYLKQVAAAAAREVGTFEAQILTLMQMAASKAEAAEEMTTPVLLAATQQLATAQQTLAAAGDIPQDALDTIKGLVGPALVLAEIVIWLATTQPADLWIGIFDAIISDICSLDFDLSSTRAYIDHEMNAGPLHDAIAGIYAAAQAKLDQTLQGLGTQLHADVAQLASAVDEEFGKIVSSYDLPLVADPTATGDLVIDHNPLAAQIAGLDTAIDNVLAKIRAELNAALTFDPAIARDMFIALIIVPLLGMLGVALTLGPLGGLALGALTLGIEELLHLIAGFLVGPFQGLIDDARKKLDAALHTALAALMSAEQAVSALPLSQELALLGSELTALRAIVPEKFLDEAAQVLGDARDVLLGTALELARDAERALGMENGTAFNVLSDNYALGAGAPYLPGGSDPMLFAGAALVRDLEKLEQARANLTDGKEFEVVQRISLKAVAGADNITGLVGSLMRGGNVLLDLKEATLVDTVYPGLYRCLIKDIRAYGQLSEIPVAPTSTGTHAFDLAGAAVPLTLTHLGPSSTRIKPTANPSAPPRMRPYPPFRPTGAPAPTAGQPRQSWVDPGDFAMWFAPDYDAANATGWQTSPLATVIGDALAAFRTSNPGPQQPPPSNDWFAGLEDMFFELADLFRRAGEPGQCLNALLHAVPAALANTIRIDTQDYVAGDGPAAAFVNTLVAFVDPTAMPDQAWFDEHGALRPNLHTGIHTVPIAVDDHGAFTLDCIYDTVFAEVRSAAYQAFVDAVQTQDRLVERWGADRVEPVSNSDPSGALGFRRLVRSLPAETAVLNLVGRSSAAGWSGATISGTLSSLTGNLPAVPAVTQLASLPIDVGGSALPTQLSYQLRPFENRCLEGQLLVRAANTAAAASALQALASTLDDVVIEIAYTACYDDRLAATLGSSPSQPQHTSAALPPTVTRVFEMRPTVGSSTFALQIGGTTNLGGAPTMAVSVTDLLANLGAAAGVPATEPPKLVGLSIAVIPAHGSSPSIASVHGSGALAVLATAKPGTNVWGPPAPAPPVTGPVDTPPVIPPPTLVDLAGLTATPETLTVTMSGSTQPYAVLFAVTMSMPAQDVVPRVLPLP